MGLSVSQRSSVEISRTAEPKASLPPRTPRAGGHGLWSSRRRGLRGLEGLAKDRSPERLDHREHLSPSGKLELEPLFVSLECDRDGVLPAPKRGL